MTAGYGYRYGGGDYYGGAPVDYGYDAPYSYGYPSGYYGYSSYGGYGYGSPYAYGFYGYPTYGYPYYGYPYGWRLPLLLPPRNRSRRSTPRRTLRPWRNPRTAAIASTSPVGDRPRNAAGAAQASALPAAWYGTPGVAHAARAARAMPQTRPGRCRKPAAAVSAAGSGRRKSVMPTAQTICKACAWPQPSQARPRVTGCVALRRTPRHVLHVDARRGNTDPPCSAPRRASAPLPESAQAHRAPRRHVAGAERSRIPGKKKGPNVPRHSTPALPRHALTSPCSSPVGAAGACHAGCTRDIRRKRANSGLGHSLQSPRGRIARIHGRGSRSPHAPRVASTTATP